MILRFDHYSQAAKGWRWSYFKPFELACRSPSTVPNDRGALVADTAFLDRLQALRVAFARPLPVTSAYRTPAHNARIGGSEKSFHVLGRAVDLAITGGARVELTALARQLGFGGFGWYQSFIHIDDRGELTSWIG